VSGELRIVASADLGEFGPTAGKPVLYHFSPLYHAQGLVPWLLLPLAFVALKENRTVQAAWILVPVVLLGAIYWTVMMVLKPTSGSAVQMNMFFAIVVVGFSTIWLLAERIGSRNRLVTFLLGALIYFGTLGANLLTGEFGKDAMPVAAVAAISISSILLAFAIASMASSRSFRKARFLALTGVSLFGSHLIILSLVMLLFYPSRPIRDQMTEVAFASFVMSLVFLLGLAPFLVLLWANRFWRRRFEGVLGFSIRP
jgi:hypothetical protein